MSEEEAAIGDVAALRAKVKVLHEALITNDALIKKLRGDTPSGEEVFMVASDLAIDRTLEIIRRHCTPEQIDAVIADLEQVPGDQSYRDTIVQLGQRWRKIAREKP